MIPVQISPTAVPVDVVVNGWLGRVVDFWRKQSNTIYITKADEITIARRQNASSSSLFTFGHHDFGMNGAYSSLFLVIMILG
jgi:hypothetical protein